jgi:hypothetical protein
MNDITLLPIVGWDLRATPAGYGMLNIKYHPGLPSRPLTQEESETSALSLQLGIAAEQAELLAQDLLAMAAQLRERRKSSI